MKIKIKETTEREIEITQFPVYRKIYHDILVKVISETLAISISILKGDERISVETYKAYIAGFFDKDTTTESNEVEVDEAFLKVQRMLRNTYNISNELQKQIASGISPENINIAENDVD